MTRKVKNRRTVRLLLCAALMLVALFGVRSYLRWLERVEYLRFLHDRQVALSELGDKLRSASPSRGYPASIQELLISELLEPNSIEYQDKHTGILVTRHYRPIPLGQDSQELVLLIETYSGEYKEVVALFGDGRALVMPGGYDDLIMKDNDHRRSHYLPELP